MKYSIWLEIQGDLKQKFSEEIEELAEKYHTPFFNPHVTLIGGVELTEREAVEKTKELATKLRPYTINLTGNLVCEEDWRRSLIVLAEPTSEVMEANTVASEVFEIDSAGYKPHASLMYTEDMSLKQKQDIAKTLNSHDFKGSFIVGSLSLYEAHYEGVKTWIKVVDFPLTG